MLSKTFLPVTALSTSPSTNATWQARFTPSVPSSDTQRYFSTLTRINSSCTLCFRSTQVKMSGLKVAEFLLRANYGLKVGGFDFDFDDGEISYRISIYCGDEEFVPPTYEQIDFAVIIGLMMIEKYGDALVKVMFGLVEPEDAIESVEEND